MLGGEGEGGIQDEFGDGERKEGTEAETIRSENRINNGGIKRVGVEEDGNVYGEREGEGELRGGEEDGRAVRGFQEVDDGDDIGEADIGGGGIAGAVAVFFVSEFEALSRSNRGGILRHLGGLVLRLSLGPPILRRILIFFKGDRQSYSIKIIYIFLAIFKAKLIFFLISVFFMHIIILLL